MKSVRKPSRGVPDPCPCGACPERSRRVGHSCPTPLTFFWCGQPSPRVSCQGLIGADHDRHSKPLRHRGRAPIHGPAKAAVVERPFMPALSVVEGAASGQQKKSSELQLDAAARLGRNFTELAAPFL